MWEGSQENLWEKRDRKDRYIVKEKEEREMLKMKISKIHMKG